MGETINELNTHKIVLFDFLTAYKYFSFCITAYKYFFRHHNFKIFFLGTTGQ